MKKRLLIWKVFVFLNCCLLNICFAETSALQSASKSTISFEKSPTVIFEEVSPAVVVITVMTSLNTMSQGSGFIVSENGLIATNFHILANGSGNTIRVRLKDGSNFSVEKIIEADRSRDICVLKINADNLAVVSLGDSNKLIPGDKVFAIGAPEGLEYSISDGLFSSERKITELGGFNSFLQVSVPFSEGSSGGPLLNSKGEVVGMTSYTKREGQNINLAIPINKIRNSIYTNSNISMQTFDTLSKSYAIFEKAKLAHSADDDNAALQFCKEAISIDQDYVDAHVLLGLIYGKTFGKVDEAIVEFKKAIKIDPNNLSAYLNIGTAYTIKGLVDEAIIEYEKAIKINKDEYVAHNGLSRLYYSKGNYDLAIEHYDISVKVGQEDPEFASVLEQYRKK